MSERPTITVAVVMRREPVAGDAARWQPWRWVLADVVLQDGLDLPAHSREPVPVHDSEGQAAGVQHWLFPGFEVALFRDDAEGYFLNLSTERPCFWVMWRWPDGAGDAELPQPEIVTLSYHDAGRWLDAQERVDQVPAPPGVLQWAQAFVDEHYQPEPKRRKRPDSFRPLTDRFGNPASVSTGKGRGGGNGDGHG